MPAWRPETQVSVKRRDFDRVGKPRLGPLPGETRDWHAYSIRTRDTICECLERQARAVLKAHRVTLDRVTPDQAAAYLRARAREVGPKRMSQERRALMVYKHLRPFEAQFRREIKSELEKTGRLATTNRALTRDDAERIISRQTERNGLSSQVALACGLRAAELLTLRPIDAREPTRRSDWKRDRFRGKEDWPRYSVQGKGGLVREVRIPPELAARVEATRHEGGTQVVRDRGVPRVTYYDLAGGRNWSSSFHYASIRETGRSLGAHSLRHSYARLRYAELSGNADPGYIPSPDDPSLRLLSQEMGHFRPEISLVYFRK